ncbi:MAG: hypothetical protein CMN32_15270 [Saprospirales bacterium]|nr:hypothetical protein [Saprospirales bacterium]
MIFSSWQLAGKLIHVKLGFSAPAGRASCFENALISRRLNYIDAKMLLITSTFGEIHHNEPSMGLEG